MGKNARVNGIDICLDNVEYVNREDIIPEIISDSLAGSGLDPITKGKLEKFVNNEVSWENEAEFHRLLELKNQLLYNKRGVQGLYEPKSNRVFVMKDSVEEWEPYFRDEYGERWEEAIASYQEILEIHECSHRKQFIECPKFMESRERLKSRKREILDELIKDRISVQRKGDKVNVTVPKHSMKKLEEKKPVIDELVMLENRLYAYKILSEGFADWCTRGFYSVSERHRDVGKIYEKLRFNNGKNQWSRFTEIIGEVASKEDILNYLNHEITYSEAREIIRKSKK